MPRQPRQKVFSNVYHIMIRGNEKKSIFIDDEDRYKFLEVISKKMIESHYEIYAYCLMNNHVHLLLKENDEGIDLCLKRINVSYVYYFNKKYNRVGHLFQDRFKSQCIDTQEYLLSAIRYIHYNPVKAGIVMNPGEYIWSSYNNYINNSLNGFVNIYEILNMFSKNIYRAVEHFIRFSNEKNDDFFIDEDENKACGDIFITNADEALKFIHEYMSDKKITIQELMNRQNTDTRDEMISFLKSHSKLTIIEISKMLNLNRGVVQRAKMC